MEQIELKKSWMTWAAIALIVAQLGFKVGLELWKAAEVGRPEILAVAIAMTIGWIVILPLCLMGRRLGYWLGAVAGLLHFALTIPLPMTGVCDHTVVAAVVSTHGALIAAACLAVLYQDAAKRGKSPFQGVSTATVIGFVLTAVSVLARFGWIVFREPTGAQKALTMLNGVGGFRELVSKTLSPIVVVSTIALCVIIPGVVMRKRWAFTACVVFGAIHVALVAFTYLGGVAQGFGPYIVWPASAGMLVGGLWMNRALGRGIAKSPSVSMKTQS